MVGLGGLRPIYSSNLVKVKLLELEALITHLVLPVLITGPEDPNAYPRPVVDREYGVVTLE